MTEVDNVTAAYDAVYAGLTTSPTLRRIWRDTVLGDDYPRGFDAACYMLHPPAATIAFIKTAARRALLEVFHSPLRRIKVCFIFRPMATSGSRLS